MTKSPSCDLLLDVSRLLWRAWSGYLPTGIDRVCLEYVRHFGDRSLAVVQASGRIAVLGAADSDRLFALLLREGGAGKTSLVAVIARALPRLSRSAPRPNMVYLNVGHTGLHDPKLPGWLEANRSRPVFLIHDLIPVTHPQFCREGEAAKHETRIRNALRSASGIIANSTATLDELKAFAAKERLPMPAAIRAWISSWQPTTRRSGRGFDRPYFLAVGTIEGRKNHALLLRVWRTLASTMGEDTPLLVIVGQRGWQAEEAISMLDRPGELRVHVREIPDCGDERLQDLVANARAVLMPSFAEGFGLPVIEALGFGTPVVASDLPVYREVVGDIPLYLDPEDDGAWEAAVRALTTDEVERERQKIAMRSFEAPDWPRHFEIVERWLPTLQ